MSFHHLQFCLLCLILLEQPREKDVAVVAGPGAGADEPVLEPAAHGRVVDRPRLHEGTVGRRADGPVQAVLLLAVPQKLKIQIYAFIGIVAGVASIYLAG